MFHEYCKDAHIFLLKWKSSDHGFSSPFTLHHKPDAPENKRNPAKPSDNLHTFMVKYSTLHFTTFTLQDTKLPIEGICASHIRGCWSSDKHVTSGGQDEGKQSTLIERVIHHRLSLPLPLEGWLLAGKTAADVLTPEAKRICGYSTRKTTLRAVKLWGCYVRGLDPIED